MDITNKYIFKYCISGRKGKEHITNTVFVTIYTNNILKRKIYIFVYLYMKQYKLSYIHNINSK